MTILFNDGQLGTAENCHAEYHYLTSIFISIEVSLQVSIVPDVIKQVAMRINQHHMTHDTSEL